MTEDFHREENNKREAYYMVQYKSRRYNSDKSSGDEAVPQQAKEKLKNTTSPFEFNLPTYATKHVDDMIYMTLQKWHHRQIIKNAKRSARKIQRVQPADGRTYYL